VVDYDQFNGAEVQQYRGVLEDIAAETGGRVKNVDLNAKGPITLTVVYKDKPNINEGEQKQ
jgi:hypothetical protein